MEEFGGRRTCADTILICIGVYSSVQTTAMIFSVFDVLYDRYHMIDCIHCLFAYSWTSHWCDLIICITISYSTSIQSICRPTHPIPFPTSPTRPKIAAAVLHTQPIGKKARFPSQPRISRSASVSKRAPLIKNKVIGGYKNMESGKVTRCMQDAGSLSLVGTVRGRYGHRLAG
ncbi:hypothetical protein CC80DRAFT_238180 [Byssothecium circinans]|uniref:Uncharacterized protein n=1 Tax=Byssothecium circinans TaxID=147558 RepID=A0A6A5U8I9_9PLEO|nr:hypothetical protein CC80DRAFT_238180 [Byssothecium circinans]